MLGNHGRSLVKAVFKAPAKGLAKLGVTPNQVTVAGTVVTVTLSLGLLARGYLALGGIVIGIVLFADSLDGTLARLTNQVSRYGAFLDSCLDRLADGVVFGALTFWAATGLEAGLLRNLTVILGIAAMIGASAVPYVRARGESVGVVAKVGIAERTDRLIVGLVFAGLTDFGLPLVLFPIGLGLVALASLVTVIQRLVYVKKEISKQ